MGYRDPHIQVYTRVDNDTIDRFRLARDVLGLSVSFIFQTGIELWLFNTEWQTWAFKQIEERRVMLVMRDVLPSRIHTTRLASMIPAPLHRDFFASLSEHGASMQDVLSLIVDEFCFNPSFRSYVAGDSSALDPNYG